MRTIHWRGLVVVIAAGAGVAPILITASPSAADPTSTTQTTTTSTPTSQSTLTVVADGSVEVTPDLASLDVNVSRTEATSRAALGAANARTEVIVAAIKRAGVPASGIQTTNVSTANTSHRVGPAGHRHEIHQYTAQESLAVSMNSKLAGKVIDAATRSGASSVNDLEFSFSNPDAGVSQANAAAITSARQQADSAAAAIGYVVTGVQSINLDPDSSTDTPPESAAGGVAASTSTNSTSTPTDVSPGQEEVDASVQVIYFISPASS